MAEFRKREDITQEIDILQTWSEMGAPRMGDLEPNLASLVKSVDPNLIPAEGGPPPTPPEPPSPYADLPPGDDEEKPARGLAFPVIALLLIGAGALVYTLTRWEPYTQATRPLPSEGEQPSPEGHAPATQAPTAEPTRAPGHAPTAPTHVAAVPSRAVPTGASGQAAHTTASGRAAHTTAPGRAARTTAPGRAAHTTAPGRAAHTSVPGVAQGKRPAHAHPHVVAAARKPPKALVREYEVRLGHSLSAIARDTLGDMERWEELYAANADQIADPDVIHPGQQLRLPETPTYKVKPGDTLKAIAKAKLGDEGRWREIYDLNRDLLPSPGVLAPGLDLKLPAGATGGGPERKASLERKVVAHHTVKPGDSLSLLARRYLGSASRWPEIYYLNSHKIANPNWLFPGQVIAIPAAHQRSRVRYVVRSGDCLWTIAHRQLGQPLRWTRIYQANRDKIRNPHWIFPGQLLRLP